MPEYSANKRNVSVTHTGGGSGSAGGIYRDGNIFTGYYQNWKDLSKKERDKVMAERERLGIKPKARGRSGRGRTAAAKTKRQLAAVVQDLEKVKRQIATIKRTSKSDGSDEEGPTEDAGEAFGGHSKRKSKKSKSG